MSDVAANDIFKSHRVLSENNFFRDSESKENKKSPIEIGLINHIVKKGFSWNFAEELVRCIVEISNEQFTNATKFEKEEIKKLKEEDHTIIFDRLLTHKEEKNEMLEPLAKSVAGEKKLIETIVKQYISETAIKNYNTKIQDNGFIELNEIYDKLDELFYRPLSINEKNWANKIGLPDDIRIYVPQPKAIKANVELKQRAASVIHAAWLALRTQFQLSLTEKELTQLIEFKNSLFEKFNSFCQLVDKAGYGLEDNAYYEYFLNTKLLNGFVPQIRELMAKKLSLNKEEAITVFEHYERFANWERNSRSLVAKNGFAVITPRKEREEKGLVIQISKPEAVKLTSEQIGEFGKIEVKDQEPLWFTALPKETQTWLKVNLKRILNGELGCPPAVLRFIPGLANVRSDRTILVNAEGEVTFDSTVIRSSVSTAVDVKNKEERKRLTQQNTAQLKQHFNKESTNGIQNHFKDFFGEKNDFSNIEPPVLFQRFLSPMWYEKYSIGKAIAGSDNNTRMLDESREAQNATMDLNESQSEKYGFGEKGLYTNWPVNAQKNKASNPFKDPENIKARKALNSLATSILKEFHAKNKLTLVSQKNGLSQKLRESTELDAETLIQLSSIVTKNASELIPHSKINARRFAFAIRALAQYQEIWEGYNKKGTIDNPHGLSIELLMAALEGIIANGLGLKVNRGCKSAKDRDAVVEMQELALIRFMDNHLHALNLNQKEHVDELSDYFAEAFLSNYHQEVVSIACSYGVHAIQDGRGETPFFEKLGIKFSRMIPEPYSQAIGRKLQEFNSNDDKTKTLSELKTGDSEINRQHILGKTAKFASVKKGFKKAWDWFSGLFKKPRKEIQNPTPNLGLSTEEQPISSSVSITVPARKILNKSAKYTFKKLELAISAHSSDGPPSPLPEPVNLEEKKGSGDLPRNCSLEVPTSGEPILRTKMWPVR